VAFEDNDEVNAGPRPEAAARGIDAQQLIFAARSTLIDHLARPFLAAHFLKTFPWNAHSTTNDVLWAGVSPVTQTFAPSGNLTNRGRVARTGDV
jgi:hypothetical protein